MQRATSTTLPAAARPETQEKKNPFHVVEPTFLWTMSIMSWSSTINRPVCAWNFGKTGRGEKGKPAGHFISIFLFLSSRSIYSICIIQHLTTSIYIPVASVGSILIFFNLDTLSDTLVPLVFFFFFGRQSRRTIYLTIDPSTISFSSRVCASHLHGRYLSTTITLFRLLSRARPPFHHHRSSSTRHSVLSPSNIEPAIDVERRKKCSPSIFYFRF